MLDRGNPGTDAEQWGKYRDQFASPSIAHSQGAGSRCWILTVHSRTRIPGLLTYVVIGQPSDEMQLAPRRLQWRQEKKPKGKPGQSAKDLPARLRAEGQSEKTGPQRR